MMNNLTRIQKKVCEIFDVDPKKVTPKGWMLTKKECPFCGKADKHFGIKLNYNRTKYKNHIVFNCFKCQESGADFALFKKLDMLSFIKDGEFVNQNSILENKIKSMSEDQDKPVDTKTKTKTPPLGYKRLYQDDYLDERGFEKWQYESYNVGIARTVSKLKNYVVFLIEEDGENKGYVARHRWSKEKIKKYEDRTGNKLLRYVNESGVDFEKLLFGIDQIVPGLTKTSILVEGVFDKTNIDKELKLNKDPQIQCQCTFGKKMSDAQIQKLVDRGIENIFLMYDPDAVNESKRYSDILKSSFKNVRVCYTSSNDGRDPGDFDYEEIIDLLSNAQDPLNFQMTKIQKRKLSG